jgi:hypothetical protein
MQDVERQVSLWGILGSELLRYCVAMLKIKPRGLSLHGDVYPSLFTSVAWTNEIRLSLAQVVVAATGTHPPGQIHWAAAYRKSHSHSSGVQVVKSSQSMAVGLLYFDN